MRTVLAPLRRPHFRYVWLGGLLSNLGTFVQSIAAAWAMTQITDSVELVALVQTATTMPTMVFGIFAGTIADLYDRRSVAIAALGLAFIAAACLALVSFLDLLTPALLLLSCFLVACGTSLFGPAWQSSVREQVPVPELPAAIALNAVSYNLGRSLGPALGGLIVIGAGADIAFGVNAVSFLPALIALYLFRTAPRLPLPRESLFKAAAKGIGYAYGEPTIRIALIRSSIVLLCASALLALFPLIAQQQLSGDAFTYGSLYALFGLGAVLGALSVSRLHSRLPREQIVRAGSALLGAGVLVLGISQSIVLSGVAALGAGMAWTALSGTFNVAVQMTASLGMAGRALSAFQATLGASVAIGSFLWGYVAAQTDVATALVCAGALLLGSPLIGTLLPIPELVADPD